MKKLFALFLAIGMVLTLSACGGKKEDNAGQNQTSAQQPADSSVVNSNAESDNPVSGVFHAATSSATGAYATIEVSSELKLEEDAWLGLCPIGKDYITEEEADDEDIVWFNYDWREENGPYVFSCDFTDVDDGTYALVVTTSDNAEIGYVIIQLKMTKEGDKLTFDFDGAKLNDCPSALQSAQPDSGEPVDGDPAEYTREYWEAKFPGENLCPFYIEEKGMEHSYFWISGFDGWDGTMGSWLSQPFNWNGWHRFADGSIVNESETLKITDNWANGDEGMSSFCTVTTEPFDKESAENSTTDSSVPTALSFKTREDLTCQENVLFSAVYVGSEEDKSDDNDGVFFDFFGEDALYYVQAGFDSDDGAVDHIWGYVRLYHFYNDEASYQEALKNVPAYALKEQNDECLYFTTGNVRNTYAESYAELMDMFANQTSDGGEYDNFTPFEG